MVTLTILGRRVPKVVLVAVGLLLLLLVLMFGQLLVPRSIGYQTDSNESVRTADTGRPVFSQGVPPPDPVSPPTT